MSFTPTPVYKEIASTLQAYENVCENIHVNTTHKVSATDWTRKHRETLEYIQSHFLPSGSGYDIGTMIDIDRGLKNGVFKLHTSFHHMNDGGYYNGWTEHDIYVKPDLLSDFTLRITGVNRNDCKDMIGGDIDYLLHAMIWQSVGDDHNLTWNCDRHTNLPSSDDIARSIQRIRDTHKV